MLICKIKIDRKLVETHAASFGITLFTFTQKKGHKVLVCLMSDSLGSAPNLVMFHALKSLLNGHNIETKQDVLM